MLVNIISLIVVLSILVFIHELGHFLAAKFFGVRVERFSVGFPPRLFGFKYGDTDYCISATPLGGYVKMTGMIDESIDEEQMKKAPEPYEFRSKPAWQQIIIITAGVIMNFLLAIGIFGGMVYVGGAPHNPSTTIGYVLEGSIADSIGVKQYDNVIQINDTQPQTWEEVNNAFFSSIGEETKFTIDRNGEKLNFELDWNNMTMNDFERFGIGQLLPSLVDQVSPESPAEAAGLQKGDRIVRINDTPIKDWYGMTEIITQNPETELQLYYLRDSEKDTIQTSITPQSITRNDADGNPVTFGRLGVSRMQLTKEVGFWDAMYRGYDQSISMITLNIRGFSRILSGKDSAEESLAGPLAIGKMAGDVARANPWGLLPFMAMLSVILAFINILPIPALDGGHLLIIIVEAIRRKPLTLKTKIAVQQFGMLILLTFMVFVFYNDIARFISG